MQFDDGSRGLPARASLAGLKDLIQRQMQAELNAPTGVTAEEQDRIADGEPYCFRCGKPASSFISGAMMAEDDEPISPAEYIRREEGTYNRDTNRFACDACYIAIGMPVGEPGNDYGWKAP